MQVESAVSPSEPSAVTAQPRDAQLPAAGQNVPPPQSGRAHLDQPFVAEAGTAPANLDIIPPNGAGQPEYRATLEDFVLWGVIAAVLAYFAWHLNSAASVLERTNDIERLAVYGLNVRADLMLLVGAALALLGCMIVLRRVRTTFSAHAGFEGSRARIVADSAGVVIVVLGVVLLAAVVTHPPRFEHGSSPSGIGAKPVSEMTADPDLEDQLEEIRRLQAHDRADAKSGSAQ
jgi:hypothetical protein